MQSSAKTVGEFLTAQGLTLGPLDTVAPDASTPLSNGLVITVTRVAKTTVAEEVEVPQPADQQVEDSSLAAGTSSVTQQGTAGKDSVTYEVTTTNGAETGKTEVARTAITPAQATVIAVGTKQSSSSSRSSSAASSSSSESAAASFFRRLTIRVQLSAGFLRVQRRQLGRNRQLRVHQQLVDQYRKWLLRWPAVRYPDLEQRRRQCLCCPARTRPAAKSRLLLPRICTASRGTSPWACAGAG